MSLSPLTLSRDVSESRLAPPLVPSLAFLSLLFPPLSLSAVWDGICLSWPSFISVSPLSLVLSCWQIDYAMVLTTTAFLASAFGNIIVHFWVRKYRKTWFVVFILAITIILSGLMLGYMGFYRTLRAALQVPLTYISSVTCKSSGSSKSTAPNTLYLFFIVGVCVCAFCIVVIVCVSKYRSWEACG